MVNARDAKHVPGRKSDVCDAQWLQRLHEYGQLRASFRPQQEIAALRAYLRHRERLLDYAAAHIQHMRKALVQMNLQLRHVISDITGVTGMRIIRAIVAGERDAGSLASYREPACPAPVMAEKAAGAALVEIFKGRPVRAEDRGNRRPGPPAGAVASDVRHTVIPIAAETTTDGHPLPLSHWAQLALLPL